MDDIFISHPNVKNLDYPDQELLKFASEAMDLSYSPYSNFKVGAAVRLDNGSIVLGANQENASYPLCICGERVALFNSSINYPDHIIQDLAIVAHNENLFIPKPVSPCGACRQVIIEYELRQNSDIRLLLKGDGNEVYEFLSGKKLLPFGFDNSYLK